MKFSGATKQKLENAKKQANVVLDNEAQSHLIRRMMFADKEYRKYLDEKWGLDLLGGQGTQKIMDTVDPFCFFAKETAFNEHHKMKIVKDVVDFY